MFYRYIGTRRKPADIDNLFRGACVLVGGGPQYTECLDALKNPNILTMAMNNTAVSFRPDLWIGCDQAANYSNSILLNPTIMKFAQLNRMGCELTDRPGVKWRTLPNTFFFPIKSDFPFRSFFHRGKYFGWWKNVFLAALLVIYRLGFNKVYTVGCGFHITVKDQYGFPSNLDEGQVKYNQRTYNLAVNQVRAILPYAVEANFEIISCTPGSKLNDIVPYEPFEKVCEELIAKVPMHDTLNVKHPKERTDADPRPGEHAADPEHGEAAKAKEPA